MRTELCLALPAGYRAGDVRAFHSRDTEGLAEQVGPAGLRKGVLLGGVPVVLEVDFAPDAARCTIDADGMLTPALLEGAREALLNILGLRIDPAAFAGFVRDDPVLGPIVARQPGLRIVQSATIFEALTWAIIGQQINLPFAISLRRTLIGLAGRPHTSGLWCWKWILRRMQRAARSMPMACSPRRCSKRHARRC